MKEEIEIKGDETSTAVKVLMAELVSNNDDVEVVEENPTRGGSDTEEDNGNEKEILEGINIGEEPEDETISKEEELRETLFFLQRKNFTRSTPFRPEDEDSENNFPVKESGQIDTILISAEQKTFNVYLEIDGDKIIDNISWSDLESQSGELAHIGAYRKAEGQYIVTVNDYPFNKEVDFSINPSANTTFNTVRAEIIIDEYTRGIE